jgi:hypothetical protein
MFDINLRCEDLFALEALGRVGAKRSDDVPEFFAELNEKKSISNLLRYIGFYSFGGLVTWPGLNDSKEYGIKSNSDFYKVHHVVTNYLEGKTTKAELNDMLQKLNYKTNIDARIAGYRPELSVTSEIDLEKLERAISNFERKADKSAWSWNEDWVNFLKNLKEGAKIKS